MGHAFQSFRIPIPQKGLHTVTDCDSVAARVAEGTQNLTWRLRRSGQDRLHPITASSTCRHRDSKSHIHLQGKNLPRVIRLYLTSKQKHDPDSTISKEGRNKKRRRKKKYDMKNAASFALNRLHSVLLKITCLSQCGNLMRHQCPHANLNA